MESEDIQMLNYKTQNNELLVANTYVIATLHLLTAGHVSCIKITRYYHLAILPHLELKRCSLRMHLSELLCRIVTHNTLDLFSCFFGGASVFILFVFFITF
jgi:hypothetical protein